MDLKCHVYLVCRRAIAPNLQFYPSPNLHLRLRIKHMQSKIIDGVAHANAMRVEFKSQVEALKAKGFQPGLAVVLVGNNPASQVYVRNKEKACIEAGMHSEVHRMAEDTSEETLLKFIRGLNENPKIH